MSQSNPNSEDIYKIKQKNQDLEDIYLYVSGVLLIIGLIIFWTIPSLKPWGVGLCIPFALYFVAKVGPQASYMLLHMY